MSAMNPMHVPKKISQVEKSKNDSKPVLESHLVLLRTSEFSDVTFIVGKSKERVPCHQLFLKARSPVFKGMFTERWNQGPKEIPLEGTDPKIFHKFLEFIYADIFVASVSEALELLQVAHNYDVQLLVSKCEQVLDSQVMLDDAIDVFQVAQMYEMTQLMNKVGDLMAQSLSRLEFLPSFVLMDKQTLMYMLLRDDLTMKEIDLFHLAMKWAKNQSGLAVGQSHIIGDILPLIRFPLMTLEEFTKVVVPTGLLPQSAVIELFTYFGTDAETKKTLANTMQFSTQQRAVDNGMNLDCRMEECGLSTRRRPSKRLRGVPRGCASDSSVAPRLDPPLLSTVSVRLYSADFANCPSRQERHDEELTDHLDFDIGEPLPGGWFGRGLFLNPFGVTSYEANQKNIVLSSIKFYCPRTEKWTNSGFGFSSSLRKRFAITVEYQSPPINSFNQKIRCVQLDVEAEEGKMVEVELVAGQVPLWIGHRYSIVVQESLSVFHTPGQTYEARDCGHIQENITTTIGETVVRFENIQRKSRVYEFSESPNRRPILIYELGLKEL